MFLCLGVDATPKKIYGSSHFSEVSTFSAIREAPKNFLLHLLNLKCLCLKIILIPSLKFQVGPTATIERLETGQH